MKLVFLQVRRPSQLQKLFLIDKKPETGVFFSVHLTLDYDWLMWCNMTPQSVVSKFWSCRHVEVECKYEHTGNARISLYTVYNQKSYLLLTSGCISIIPSLFKQNKQPLGICEPSPAFALAQLLSSNFETSDLLQRWNDQDLQPGVLLQGKWTSKNTTCIYYGCFQK